MSKIDSSELFARKSELCLSCLECCKWLRFDCGGRTEKEAKAMSNFYTVRGCQTKIVQLVDYYLLVVLVPTICPFLSQKGCSRYDTRPPACRHYDGRKDIMISDVCKWKELGEED